MNEIDYATLAKGNILAKQWARKILGRRKLGKFLSFLFNSSGADKLKPSQMKAISEIPAADRAAILATQDIAAVVFVQFEKLATRIARRFAKGVGRDNPADISQLESESNLGLLKATRGYSNVEIKFVTYVYRACTNEVSRYIQRSMGTTLSGTNFPLLVKYKKKREELMKASLPATFEDVCEALKLSRLQSKKLSAAIRSEVSSENEMEESLAATLLDSRRSSTVDAELITKLESIALPAMERDAFISQNSDIRELFPDALPSLKDVAARFKVTPQAASEALKRARRKLAVGLGDDWKI